MDKTAKLILWHRLAIVWLVITTITTALMLREEQQGKARLMINLQNAAGVWTGWMCGTKTTSA
jgi:hypothetical protein